MRPTHASLGWGIFEETDMEIVDQDIANGRTSKQYNVTLERDIECFNICVGQEQTEILLL